MASFSKSNPIIRKRDRKIVGFPSVIDIARIIYKKPIMRKYTGLGWFTVGGF